jgi:hypothetical protein
VSIVRVSKTTRSSRRDKAVPPTSRFLSQHADDVLGVLNGFDRLRLRGTLRLLANVQGMKQFLWHARVPLTEFGAYVQDVTTRVKQATEAVAATAERPLQYVSDPTASKEAIARDIAARDRVTTGLICTLKSVEGCWSYEVQRDRDARRLVLRAARRKCLHYYHYFLDPRLGFMHARLQSWFPFTLHVCLNGREWLARQMDAAGLAYQQRENCFVWIADVGAAQALADTQLRTAWPRLLNAIAQKVHPAHGDVLAAYPVPYYWSLEQSEWASDVLFRSPAVLGALYPLLVTHAMQHVGSRDVMRFLGKRVTPVTPAKPLGIHGHFQGEVVTDLVQRREGVRVKHRVNGNWVKMYDKQGSVLRVETVINDGRDLRVFRRPEGDPKSPKRWCRLRKGIADARRRAVLSQQANTRYLDTLAAVDVHEPLATASRALCRRVRWQGRSVRALNPLSAIDGALLTAIYRGEFVLTGFRNRDLRELRTARTASAVTRQLRLLRAHGLIRKVSHTHRYLLTARARVTIAALLAARQADTATLSKAA